MYYLYTVRGIRVRGGMGVLPPENGKKSEKGIGKGEKRKKWSRKGKFGEKSRILAKNSGFLVKFVQNKRKFTILEQNSANFSILSNFWRKIVNFAPKIRIFRQNLKREKF